MYIRRTAGITAPVPELARRRICTAQLTIIAEDMLQAMQVGQTAGKIIVRETDTARARITKTDITEILIPHRVNTTLREEICRETRRTKGTEHFRNTEPIKALSKICKMINRITETPPIKNTERIRIDITEILISGRIVKKNGCTVPVKEPQPPKHHAVGLPHVR